MSRDSQREALYNAERDVRAMQDRAYEFPTIVIQGSTIVIPERLNIGSLAGYQGFVAKVQEQAWYKARYPSAGPISVRNRKSANRAHYQGGTIAVAERTHRLEQYAMHADYALHEMAHHVSQDGHGPQFAANYLVHLREVRGPEMYLLMLDAFQSNAVKIDWKTLV